MAFSYNGNKIDPSAAAAAITGVAANDLANANFICLLSNEPLTRAQKSQLKDRQVQFQEYLGGNAWLCKYEPDARSLRDIPFISRVFPVRSDFKISPALKSGGENAEKQTVDVAIHQLSDQSAEQLSSQISDITGIAANDMDFRHDNSIVRLKVDDQQLYDIAKLDDVASIDKVQALKLYNNLARGVLNSNYKLNNTTFQGKGQVITVADTGFDSGDKDNSHPAFKKRVVGLVPIGRTDKSDDVHGHGTHVCGSALGDGVSETMGGTIQGTAPAASLVVQALLSDPILLSNGQKDRILFGTSGKTLGNLLTDAYDNHGSRVHTNSWGPVWNESTRTQSPYGNGGRDLDSYVWSHQDLVVCFAAGNDGEEKTAKPGAGHVGGQSSAKNCITVGSCDNNRPSKTDSFETYDENGTFKGDPGHVSVFSSRGPTAEGRIKPDVIAPGSMILSTRSSKAPQQKAFGLSKDQAWMFDTGTSMATPLVAGCAAALREHLIIQGIKQPSAALVKALLINGAVDLKRPITEQGFGRVDLSNSIFDLKSTDKGIFEDKIYNQDGRDIVKKEIVLKQPSAVAAAAKGSPVTFKATLVYMDQQGEQLQNNLNLIVYCKGQKRHGNKGDVQNQYDNVNTVEQVIWKGSSGSGSGSGPVIGETVTIEVSYREVMNADVVPFAVAWAVNT